MLIIERFFVVLERVVERALIAGTVALANQLLELVERVVVGHPRTGYYAKRTTSGAWSEA